MKTAKQELLQHIGLYTEKRHIFCATIQILLKDEDDIEADLPVGYTEDMYQDFLKKIDKDYRTGADEQQHQYGKIWYTDKETWSRRREANGYEWWEFMRIPVIPPYLRYNTEQDVIKGVYENSKYPTLSLL